MNHKNVNKKKYISQKENAALTHASKTRRKSAVFGLTPGSGRHTKAKKHIILESSRKLFQPLVSGLKS